MNERIFREYDIRGIVEQDLTDDVVYDLGRAIGTFMLPRGHKTLNCGYDLRLSSSHIHDILIEGILSTGMDVTSVGLVPTPVLYYSIIHLKADVGVMVTGSHNPIEFNGFKISEGLASIYGKDIQNLKEIIIDQKFIQRPKGDFKKVDIVPDYIKTIKAKLHFSKKLKVVIDAGNATAGTIAPNLWRELGMQVIELFCEPDGTFPNHLPDPTVPKYMEKLSKVVVEKNADLGIGYDGDADRVGAVDEKGHLIFADTLLAIFSKDILQKLAGSQLIFDVKCTQALPDIIRAHGGKPLMWKTGHSLLKAKMKETGSPFAGEMSGHMFFADNYYGFDDGIYASGRLMEILTRTDKTFSDLVNEIPHYYSSPEIRVECADEDKFDVITNLAERFKDHDVIDIDGIRVQFETGWGLVRASNTQPTLVLRFEAKSQNALNEIVERFKKELAQFPQVKFNDTEFEF